MRTLAAKVNLGRGYANAICSRVGIEPSLPAKEITPSQCETILKELSDLLQGIEGESAFAWAKDAESLEKINQEETPGEIPPFLEVAPVDLAHLQLDLRIDFQSISEAADRWWGAHDASAYARREMEKMVELGEAEETAGSQLGRRAEQQEGAIEAFQIKAEKSQQKAQSIIDNYDHVNEILEQVLHNRILGHHAPLG